MKRSVAYKWGEYALVQVTQPGAQRPKGGSMHTKACREDLWLCMGMPVSLDHSSLNTARWDL